MQAVNLYILAQAIESKSISDYEMALTNRKILPKIRPEELETVKGLVEDLVDAGAGLEDLDGFFYSFSIPRISKEFDLLKIMEKGPIINIELKSQMVTEDKIKKQLLQNRHYLSHINTEIYSFTYVKGKKKVYVLEKNELKEKEIPYLLEKIMVQGNYIEKHIADYFRPQDYLISPINTPEKFLKGQYYLTNQQDRFKENICDGITYLSGKSWGINGSAGTGKTLLLYDIARKISEKKRVCIIHAGMLSEGHHLLNDSIPGLDIFPAKGCKSAALAKYDCFFIDEAHRINRNLFYMVRKELVENHKNGVFAYDFDQVLSQGERRHNVPKKLKKIPGFSEIRLSEKIRTNKEIVSFIFNLMDLKKSPKNYIDFSRVEVLYAKSVSEAEKIIRYYMDKKDYVYISQNNIEWSCDMSGPRFMNTHRAIGQEFDKLMISMDDNFYYDSEGFLQVKEHPNPDYIFFNLWFQGITRAREELCILVIDNDSLLEKILKIKNRPQ